MKQKSSFLTKWNRLNIKIYPIDLKRLLVLRVALKKRRRRGWVKMDKEEVEIKKGFEENNNG